MKSLRRRGYRFTDDECERIRQLWTEGVAVAAICEMLGVTRDTFHARRSDQLADLPARPRGVWSGQRIADPSEDEIAALAAAIRASWTDSERLERLASGRVPPVRERVFRVREILG